MARVRNGIDMSEIEPMSFLESVMATMLGMWLFHCFFLQDERGNRDKRD